MWPLSTFTQNTNLQQRTRLGELLLHDKLVDSATLDQAVAAAKRQNKMLGEVLCDWGLLSRWQLSRYIGTQKFVRFVAASVLATVTFATDAYAINKTKGRSIRADSMVELSDTQLSQVHGQGLSEQMAGLVIEALDNDFSVEQIRMLVTALMPLADAFDGDISMEGLDGAFDIELEEDGSLRIKLPKSIKRISIEDFRVAGAQTNKSFGNVFLNDIQFGDTNIRVEFR